VAFHAHPDDEVLLTGGTLARLAAEGNRVVIVVACDGSMGAAADEAAQVRLGELRASAAALGAHQSQLRGTGRGARLMRLLAALPTPVFGLLLGREWLAEPSGRAADGATGRRQRCRDRAGRTGRHRWT
jgi:LmbE family N-acetylglucosaminyl deacetylase